MDTFRRGSRTFLLCVEGTQNGIYEKTSGSPTEAKLKETSHAFGGKGRVGVKDRSTEEAGLRIPCARGAGRMSSTGRPRNGPRHARSTVARLAGIAPLLAVGLPWAAHGAENHPATGKPTINGVLEAGRYVSMDISGVADEDGLTEATTSGEVLANWFRVSTVGKKTLVPPVNRSLDEKYAVRSGVDEGKRLQIQMRLHDDAGNAEVLWSEPSDIVSPSSVPLISIPATGASVVEGGNVLVSLRRSGDLTEELTVGVEVDETASVIAGTPPASVTFAAGRVGTTLIVATEDDGTDEPSGSVSARVVPGAGYGPEWSVAAIVRVFDNDHVALAVSSDTLEVAEGAGTYYTVALASEPGANTTVRPHQVGGDEAHVHPLDTHEFTPSNWNTPQHVIVVAMEDADANDESFEIRHAVLDADMRAAGIESGIDPISVEVHVVDNDDVARPVITVSASPTSIDEGESSTITVGLSNGVTLPTALTIVLTASGTASTGDYTLAPTTLTLAAGSSSATATLTAAEDTIGEAAETVTVNASAASNAPVGSAAVTIRASDGGASDDATLRALTLSGIDIGTFSSGTTSYAADVPHGVSSTVATATPNDAGAVVVIADADGSSAGASRTVSLAQGSNAITATVTAANGATTKTYTVTVTRAATDARTPPDQTARPALTAGETHLDAAWTAPADNGAAITGYDVERRATPGGTWTDAGHAGTGTSLRIAGLSADTAYEVRVRAVNGAGAGGWSPAAAARTTAGDGAPSDDATLRALTLSGIDIGTFSSGTTNYAADVAHGVSSTVVAATPNDAGAGVVISDAHGSTAGTTRTVALDEGANAIAVVVTAADGTAATYTATVTRAEAARRMVPLFPSASDAHGRQGFVRVINHSDASGEVAVEAVDDGGSRYGPLALAVGANATAHFNSEDLEDGNADKGLTGSTGPGQGDWRLELTSGLDIEVLSYVRTADGFLAAMHDVAPEAGGRHRVAIFNPGSNVDQQSLLRLVNPGTAAAQATVAGVDDKGRSPGDGVGVSVPAGASVTYTAAELESGGGTGLSGSLGDGEGKWRLVVESAQRMVAMSLLSSPTGHLANLSTAPGTQTGGMHAVPLFPAASDALGRQGVVRVVNRGGQAGEVRIEAFDDTDREYDAVTLAVGAGEAAHFNSDDLEDGNADKGLTGSTGAGTGAWRLELTSALDIEVLSYVRTADGFLTAMHDVVPRDGTRYRVAVLNPGGNADQVSQLRLVNAGENDALVTITGVDDAGASPGTQVRATVPAGGSATLTAQQLESGGEDIQGALGDGTGKWQLLLESQRPVVVMSLLSSPTGHLSNLSTAPARSGP